MARWLLSCPLYDVGNTSESASAWLGASKGSSKLELPTTMRYLAVPGQAVTTVLNNKYLQRLMPNAGGAHVQEPAALSPWTFATRVKVFSNCFFDSYHEGKALDSHQADARGDASSQNQMLYVKHSTAMITGLPFGRAGKWYVGVSHVCQNGKVPQLSHHIYRPAATGARSKAHDGRPFLACLACSSFTTTPCARRKLGVCRCSHGGQVH